MNIINNAYNERNKSIYKDYLKGIRQKVIAENYFLSVSRVKAIIAEMKRL